MKTLLIAVLTSLSFTALASTVIGTNQFPGYGAVSSDKVCLTSDSVKANIPASSTQECTKYTQGLNGESCVAYKTVTKAARQLEAPLSFEAKTCLESKNVFDNSFVPKRVCVKYGTATYHQPRAYSVVTVEQEDVFHDRLITTRHDIPNCQ